MDIGEHFKGYYKGYVIHASRCVDQNVMAGEDIVQETYARAIKYQDSFNPALSSFNTWVASILNTCIKDYIRAERTQGSYVDLEEHHLRTEDDGQEQLSTALKISEEIAKYPDDYKQTLFLYFMKGYRIRDICKVLDDSRSVIAKRVQRFKSKMRQKYGGQYETNKDSNNRRRSIE